MFHSHRDQEDIVQTPNVSTFHLRTPAHFRWERCALSLELARHPLELLHSPDFIPPRWGSFRKVITVHDLAFRIFPDTVTEETTRYYEQIDDAVQQADAIIAVSECTRRDAVQYAGAPESRIRVIYEAAGLSFQPQDRNIAQDEVNARLSISAPFILFVSAIEPRKNVETIFEAMAKPAMSSVQFVLAGAHVGFSQAILETARKLGVHQRVRAIGRVDLDTLVWLYNAASLVVYPSIYEGFGLPVLEAMACGAPVVCSNCSSLPEVAGDAAILVAPHDVDGWANSISGVLEDPTLWQAMREKGFRQAARFSWQVAAQQTLAVYRQVLQR
jgi:glycosyltransferase involved in cell wall biosynthesis